MSDQTRAAVARLQSLLAPNGDDEEMSVRQGDVAAVLAEIERLRSGWLRMTQNENQCSVTGQPCREPMKCGCWLEMAEWMKEGQDVR